MPLSDNRIIANTAIAILDINPISEQNNLNCNCSIILSHERGVDEWTKRLLLKR